MEKRSPGIFGMTFVDIAGRDKIDLYITYAEDCYDKETIDRYAELIFKAVGYLEGEDNG
jgi:hypothetical protein